MAAVLCECYLIVQASHIALKLYEPSIAAKEAPCEKSCEFRVVVVDCALY